MATRPSPKATTPRQARKPASATKAAARPLEETITADVIARLEKTPDPRLREVMIAFVRHLHAFIREIEPTEAEWMEGIKFLTAIGQKCDDMRQEFILFSDTHGATMLIDAINHRMTKGATESSVLGPFYRDGAPEIRPGQTISLTPDGEPCIVRGKVCDPKGKPVAGALLDIWQTAANGMYEGQDRKQPAFNLRGRLHSGADGSYEFRTVVPVCYPIPDDGPVGKLLKVTGRHPFRPAHIHFIVSAKGYKPVVTQVFADIDPYIRSDAVFGVKDSLIAHFDRHDDRTEARKLGVKAPFYTLDYDFGLEAAR